VFEDDFVDGLENDLDDVESDLFDDQESDRCFVHCSCWPDLECCYCGEPSL
jgi:hypothetical protein